MLTPGNEAPVMVAAGNMLYRVIVTGTAASWMSITEPSGGSDPAGAMQCRAVRKGDSYVLNGSKIFISHAHEAEWGVVFARTDPKAGRSGITCFIIHKGQPGFSARPFKTLRTAALSADARMSERSGFTAFVRPMQPSPRPHASEPTARRSSQARRRR